MKPIKNVPKKELIKGHEQMQIEVLNLNKYLSTSE
jgi:hypothetical protein